MSEYDRNLRETVSDQRKQIEKLELALLNAAAIEETFRAINKKFDEITQRLAHLGGCVGNLESDLGHQKQLIVKSLQLKYGTGPTA